MAFGADGRRRRRSTWSRRAVIGVSLLISAVGWGVLVGVVYVAVRGPESITVLFGDRRPGAVAPAAGQPTTLQDLEPVLLVLLGLGLIGLIMLLRRHHNR